MQGIPSAALLPGSPYMRRGHIWAPVLYHAWTREDKRCFSADRPVLIAFLKWHFTCTVSAVRFTDTGVICDPRAKSQAELNSLSCHPSTDRNSGTMHPKGMVREKQMGGKHSSWDFIYPPLSLPPGINAGVPVLFFFLDA